MASRRRRGAAKDQSAPEERAPPADEQPSATDAVDTSDADAGDAGDADAGDTSDADAEAEEESQSDPPAEEPQGLRAWLAGAPLSKEFSLLLGLVAPAIVLALNMWRVRSFTIDDAYISFRYARNLARGLGLVYNPGERIEGYTNFLWTLLLAGGIALGIDPDVLAKVLGAACAFGALGLTWILGARFRPYSNFPCVATWLLASTIVFTGYSIFGLETALFVFLILLGTELMFREEPAYAAEPGAASTPGSDVLAAPWYRRLPYSGVVFGFAGLTRPEAPMFVGLLMLFLGRGMIARRNLLRAALFVAPVGAHMLWRHSYYGTWLPNTLSAKTGNLSGQLASGWEYVQSYFTHAGVLVWLALFGVALGIVARRRDVLAVSTLAAAVIGYVCLVGGDWMPFFRFMSPFEPFCFLLVDLAARTIIERRERAANLAILAFGVAMLVHRIDNIRDAQRSITNKEERFWRMAAGGTARWLNNNGVPGEVAMGDIGYVGYSTDYPVLDLLGLVDPVISKLPGGYTRKLGPGFTDRFFDKAPMYFLLISSNMDCQKPSVPGSQHIYNDKRFRGRYEVAGKVPLDDGFAWCIYRKRPGI